MNVEQNIIESLDRYITQRIPTGGFLRAVLSNNLEEAMARADDVNRHALFDIVKYVVNVVPRAAWGSEENVRVWLEGPRNEESSDEV